VDVTGNTHRAEFCIDNSTRGFIHRAASGCSSCAGFENAAARPHEPHSTVAGARAARVVLEAALHREPIHWGTRLHDQFMLRVFCSAGFSRRAARSEPGRLSIRIRLVRSTTSSFATPAFGHAHHAGVDLEVRQATEPWYVLGEEGGAGGTARYVDSSVSVCRSRPRSGGGPLCNRLQWAPHAAALYRQTGRMGGRRAISRWQPASACIPPFPFTRRHLRRRGYLDRPFGGRLHLSRLASRRPKPRQLPGKCE